MRNEKNIFSNVDKLTVLFYLLLVFIGWISIYAAVYNEEHHSIFDVSQRYGMQLIWIGAAFFIALVILLLEGTFFTTFAYPIFIIVMLTLVAVLLFGAEVNGSKSWFKIGSFQLQPSEFAKFATVLALSKYLSTLNIKMKDIKTKVIAMSIIAIPAVLILLQNDTGSTLVYAAFIFVLYREGLSGNILLFGVLAIVIFVLTLVFGPINIILTVTFFAIVFYTLFKYDIKTTLTSVIFYLTGLFAYYYFRLDEVLIYYVIGSILLFFLLVLMVKKEMRDRSTHFFAIVIFLFTCLYIFSIDFTFNKVLQEHQRTRITVLLGEEDKLMEQIEELKLELEDDKISKEEKSAIKEDLKVKKSSLKDLRQGNGWNIKQSLIAIGSGGFTGKGFLEGTQTKYDFVPEQSTDFIFCTIGEEWGFFGSFVLVCLYVGLFLRIIFLAERQRSIFSRIYGYAVASILFFHFLVNIGMAIGLAPVIGIPLPFISYGGSSLWSFTILLFIFIKLDAERINVLR
ncbi:MAG: rod shape-determining protein RodA [Flavobacteriales bacterium]|nr:rod shape-determining protein RodA [Flavobacteriales bacterium]MCB9175205.1 rod shape-determining protein RodA [Flavobacteriales bacterium]